MSTAGRPLRPPPPRGQDIYAWGETTRGPEGAGRRIHVANAPPNATLEDYRNFFGIREVEGVYKGKHKFAVVQFKTPKAKTEWVLRNTETFMGSRIYVKEYIEDDRRPKRPIKAEPSRSASRALALSRINRSRTRSRSRSRDRSNRRDTSRDRNDHHRDQHSRTSSRRDSRERAGSRSSSRVSSMRTSPERNHHKQRSTGKASPSRQLTTHDSIGNHNFEEPAAPWAEQRPANGHLMPYDIELLLKLALDHGTFRDFSPAQFDQLISFINKERGIVQPSGVSAQQWGMNAQLTSHQFGPSYMHPANYAFGSTIPQPAQIHQQPAFPAVAQPATAYPAIQHHMSQPPLESQQPSPPLEKLEESPQQSSTPEQQEVTPKEEPDDSPKSTPQKFKPGCISDTVKIIRMALREGKS